MRHQIFEKMRIFFDRSYSKMLKRRNFQF